MIIEEWKLADIKPYFRNSKKHNVDHIKESIDAFKVDQPIVVDADGVIIKGHGRLKAAKQLKMKTFPVVARDDLTPEQVRLSRLADNESAKGGTDESFLIDELNDLDRFFDLKKFGFDDFFKTDEKTELSESDENIKKRDMGDDRKKIKLVFYSESSDIIERAILKTKNRSRVEAIKEIFEFYDKNITSELERNF